MEESTAPAAPASEATPTTNPAPAEAPQAPAAPTANIPADQIEAFNKFVDSNGGFEKAFSKLRTDVSTPAPQPAQAPEQPSQIDKPEQQPQQAQAAQLQQAPDGYISRDELSTWEYFNRLANTPDYAPIAAQLRDGTVVKEMNKFNIKVAEGSFINAKGIKDFLDLYVKTVPTPAPAAPVTNTPTVDYVNVGEQITNRDDAMKILEQNRTLKPGIAPHPQTEAAKEFLKGYFNGTKK